MADIFIQTICLWALIKIGAHTLVWLVDVSDETFEQYFKRKGK